MFLSLLQTGAKDTFIFSLRLLIGFRLAKIHFMRPPGKKLSLSTVFAGKELLSRRYIYIDPAPPPKNKEKKRKTLLQKRKL